MHQIDAIAQLIRRLDGNHDLGAGALAEALYEEGVRFFPETVTDDARAEWVTALERECIQADAAMLKWVRVPVKAVRAALAAGRAETTTEHPCGDYPAPCNCDDPETHDGAISAETTTATTEDAALDAATEAVEAEF